MSDEGFLEWMKVVAGGQAFDGRKLTTIGLNGEHQARPDRSHTTVFVAQYRASPAYPVFAAHMSSCQAQLMAQEVTEEQIGRYRTSVLGAVYPDGDSMHPPVPPPIDFLRHPVPAGRDAFTPRPALAAVPGFGGQEDPYTPCAARRRR